MEKVEFKYENWNRNVMDLIAVLKNDIKIIVTQMMYYFRTFMYSRGWAMPSVLVLVKNKLSIRVYFKVLTI